MTLQISLNGNWTAYQTGTKDSISAQVPGTIHQDLLRQNRIPDPFYRDNEDTLQWIGEKNWTFEREFTAPEELLKHELVFLRCHGLDTLARLFINDRFVGETDNMFRMLEFGARPYLQPGANKIRIEFNSVISHIQEREGKRSLTVLKDDCWIHGRSWIRKQQSNFGWDWGPKLVTCGIWKDIELVGYSRGRFRDVAILQHHEDKVAELTLGINVEAPVAADLKVHAVLSLDGEAVAESGGLLNKAGGRLALKVTNPLLWWPAGMGEQPLYDLRVVLADEQGTVLDEQTKRIGLRRLELRREKDRWGESFGFAVNGVPFFAKGADWIPSDAVISRANEKQYRSLLQSAADANMNMVRVWGGGFYEHDYFYDICDELGLCVWQDFMFACASYPADKKYFMENVRQEAIGQVRRLRHHACMALWCGNNELTFNWVAKSGWPRMPARYYKKLFHKLLPEVVARHDPQRGYWPSSPFSGLKPRFPYEDDPTSGNAHLWAVWHKKEPFEWYRTSFHRFCTEFGFQSFPEPRTVASYTLPEDRNVTGKIMERHQRSAVGNSVIMHYMLSWYRLPVGFENTLWLSQIQQGLAIKYAVEHWRRNMDRCRGAVYWQLNDCWPVASWASIDYFGRWKALHYMAKRFFNPLLVSIVEDKAAAAFDIHVSCDRLQGVEGTVRWTLVKLNGEILAGGQENVALSGACSEKIVRVAAAEQAARHGKDSLGFFADLEVDGEVVSSNFAALSYPKHMMLEAPEIGVTIEPLDTTTYRVSLQAAKISLWVWLEFDGLDFKCSDNFFCLAPEAERTVQVVTAQPVSVGELRGKLRVKSIFDTYQEER